MLTSLIHSNIASGGPGRPRPQLWSFYVRWYIRVNHRNIIGEIAKGYSSFFVVQ